MNSRRAFFLAGAAAAVGATRLAKAAGPAVRIGVLTDMSGVLSSVLGVGSVTGARMAIEDFGSQVAGMPVELVFADHQNKPDVASSITRKWLDQDGVDLVMDLGQSACAIAAQGVVKERNKVIIVTGAASSELTNKYCNRNAFHWGYDTYMQSAAVAADITKSGGDTWFFLTADYAYGHTLEADAKRAIEQEGGRVVGAVRHPANTHDFSSFLLQAQASKAKMIGVASAGADLELVLKQGAEFGLWAKQSAVAFGLQLYNVPVIGVQPLQGVLHNSIFYWDRNEASRQFSRRFQKVHGKPPAETHAVNYSAVTQYLKAIKAAGTKEADPVIKALNDLPVVDAISGEGKVRADGRLIRPTFLVQVKKPQEVKETWDCLSVVKEIPGERAFRPVSESVCPALKTGR